MCCEERNTQRRTTSSSCIFRRALRARRSRVTFLSVICYALLLLGFFTTDDFVRVAHTFAFVRLWWTEVADLGGHLTYQLLVDALDQDIGLARSLSGDAFRQFVIHWVREAKSQVQHLTFCLRFVTNTDQLELALEALAYALDHVVYQRTSGTGHCASLLIAIASSKTQLTSFFNDFNGRMDVQFKSTLGTLHRKLLACEFYFDTGWQLNGVLSDARHAYPPLEHSAKNFAADTGSARSTISHHTFVGGDDRHTETTTYLWQIFDGLVLTQAWTANALHFFDDRTAFEVFQLDGQQRLGFAADLITRDVTFVLQDFCYSHLQRGRRHAYDGLFSHLGITDSS
ncbi:hypothetical protein EMIT0P2_70017 [Pseudomonas sp. IT-P2]